MYGEDIDLCYRIQKAGNKIYYLGDQTIVHFKGESTKKNSASYVRMFYQAMSVFVKKHYSSGNAKLIKILLNMGINIRAFLSLIASPFKDSKKIQGRESGGTDILLVGDPISAAEAGNIIKNYMPDVAIKKLQSLRSVSIESDQFSEIVFCTGRLSYEESIGLTVKAKDNFSYKWHVLQMNELRPN